jgi:hypothetical protein
MFTCGACSEATLSSALCKIAIADIDLEILKCGWNSGDNTSAASRPYNEGPLKDILLDPNGVTTDSEGNHDIQLLLCKTCYSSIKRKKNSSTFSC